MASQSEPPPRVYRCDGCALFPDGDRHRCQACPDFDFCSDCVADAPLIHPGHSFKNLGPVTQARSSDGSAASPASNLVTKGFRCSSCAAVSRCLPALYLEERSRRVEAAAKGETVEDGALAMRWRMRLSHLVAAVQRGCVFCSFIMKKFFVGSNLELYSYLPSQPWYAAPLEHPKEREEAVTRCMELLGQLKHDGVIFNIVPSTVHSAGELPDFDRLLIAVAEVEDEMETVRKIRLFPSAGVLEVSVDVYVPAADPASTCISARPPNPNPGSDEALHWAREQMEHCNKAHGDACRPAAKDFLPTRLLAIGRDGALHLHDTAPGEKLSYAALSYCWGGEQEFKSLSATMEERRAGFSAALLPQTLQDAIRVAQNLGLSHLWVDSLCIIQDDAADKAREVSRMAEIYQHANLTICAASTGTASEGFLNSRADANTGLWKRLIPLAYHIPNPDATTFVEGRDLPPQAHGSIWLMDEPLAFDDMFSDPVEQRGWCLQERMLSPRMLWYGRWPQWRCRHGIQSDGGRSQTGNDKDSSLFNFSATPSTQHDPQALLREWPRLIQHYTRRELARDGDCLPAIGGLAQEIARLTNADYLAGFWRPTLLRDLLWSAKTREWMVRPVPWRAPSWSWAGVKAPVSYAPLADTAIALATVRSCSVALDNAANSPFGEIMAGELVIAGPFAQLPRDEVLQLINDQNMGRPPPPSNDVTEWYRQIMEDIASQPKDGPGQLSKEDGAKALPEGVCGLIMYQIGNGSDGHNPSYSGLLLAPLSGEKGAYERIGAFLDERRLWLDQSVKSWPTKEVTIA